MGGSLDAVVADDDDVAITAAVVSADAQALAGLPGLRSRLV
jgi:hypothetical protein